MAKGRREKWRKEGGHWKIKVTRAMEKGAESMEKS